MNRTLFIIDESGDESRFDMTQPAIVIGRDADADITVADERVSRSHLRLTHASGEIIAEDLNSSNGTTLNGESFVGKRILKSGDRLRLGNQEIHIDKVSSTGRSLESTMGEPSVSRAQSRHAPRSRMPLAAAVIAVAVVGVVLLRRGAETAPASSTLGTEVIESSAIVDEASAPKITPTPNQAASVDDRFMSNRKLANARVELRLKVEEAILEEDLPAAANALKSFEDAHGMRSARTARSHLSVATKALLSRSLNEWQALHASASTKDTQSWLARKRKAFPKHSTDFERLRDAVSNWSTNPIALIAKGSAAETASRSPAQAPEVPASKAAVTAVMDPSATHASLSADAQDKEKARRYRDAVALWIAAGEIARKENMGRRAELEAKRQSRRLALQANAIDVIAKGINGDPRAFKKLRCLANRNGDAKQATTDGVKFAFDKEVMTLPWKAIRDRCLIDMIRRCKLTTDEQLPCAQLLLAMKEDDRAHKLMQSAVEADSALIADVGQLLSDHLGMDRPEGTFCWIEGRYLSPREARRVATRTSITVLTADIASDDPDVRRSAAERLFALGASAQSAFHRALMDEKERILKTVEGSKTYHHLKTMGDQAVLLRDRRRAVLDLVFDTHLYPYPYRGVGPEVRKRYQETQSMIDNLKVGVRELWSSATVVRVGPKFRAGLARVGELNGWLETLELGRGGNDPEFLLYLPQAETVNIQTFALDEQERERIDDSALAMNENATRKTAASNGETRQVELTNLYRLMMGRRAVRIHDILTRSIRGHCEDMARLGFFAHINEIEPEKRTPSDRARLMGFNGGVSENIAINSGAQGAHNAWIHSSGHHRNILGLTHRVMGAGNQGKRWGQVFSGQEPERLVPADDDNTVDDDS